MRTQSAQFEWRIAERAEEGRATLDTPPNQTPAARFAWARRRHALLAWTLFSLLLCAVGVGYLWSSAAAGWRQIETELGLAVELDEWAQRQPRDATAVARGSLDKASPHIRVETFTVHGSDALVQVVVTQTLPSGETVAQRELRFFQQTARGWIRSTPQSTQLGAWQSLEIEYFQLHYQPIDAKATEELAAKLDELYAKISANFGVSPAPLERKIQIKVVTDRREVRGLTYSASGYMITIPSTILLQAPTEWSNANVLYESAIEPLTEFVIARAAGRYWAQGHPFNWQPFLNGMRLWQLWQSGGSLAEQRAELVHWFYQSAQDQQKEQPLLPPACRLSPLWTMSSPALATVCQDLLENVDVPDLARRNHASAPLRLAQIAAHDSVPPGPRQWGETLALETVVEYAVATYGSACLPRLLQALGRYDTWESLIPAVFGVSAAEFEQGWQAYLVGRYAVEPGMVDDNPFGSP